MEEVSNRLVKSADVNSTVRGLLRSVLVGVPRCKEMRPGKSRPSVRFNAVCIPRLGFSPRFTVVLDESRSYVGIVRFYFSSLQQKSRYLLSRYEASFRKKEHTDVVLEFARDYAGVEDRLADGHTVAGDELYTKGNIRTHFCGLRGRVHDPQRTVYAGVYHSLTLQYHPSALVGAGVDKKHSLELWVHGVNISGSDEQE